MAAPVFLTNVPGGFQQVAATQNGGAANAEKVVALNAAGILESDLLSPDIGRNIVTVGTSEALTALNLVNIHTVSGAARVRKADSATASGGKKADGLVLADSASPGTAKVYRSGLLTGLTGLSPGLDYYLGPNGSVTATPPTTSGQTQQFIGKAVSATAIDVQLAPFIGIA